MRHPVSSDFWLVFLLSMKTNAIVTIIRVSPFKPLPLQVTMEEHGVYEFLKWLSSEEGLDLLHTAIEELLGWPQKALLARR